MKIKGFLIIFLFTIFSYLLIGLNHNGLCFTMTISDGIEGKCSEANVGCNEGNKVYSSWIVKNEDMSYICFRKSINNGRDWKDIEVIFETNGNYDIKNLNMLNDNSGRIYMSFVVSNQEQESGWLYFIYSLSDGETWSDANIMNTIHYDVNYYKMVINDEGIVHFLYKHSDPRYWGYSKRYVRDEQEYDASVDDPRSYFADFADICCYESKVYIVSGNNKGNGEYSMFIRKSEDGGNTWGQSEDISIAKESDNFIVRCTDLQIRCDESGKVYIGYLEHLIDTQTDVNILDMLYLRNSDSNAMTWKSPIIVRYSGGHLSLPKIEVTDDFVYIFWFEGDKLMLKPYLIWDDTLKEASGHITVDENIVRPSFSSIDSSKNDRYYCLYYKETTLGNTSLRAISPHLMHSGTVIGTRVGDYQLVQNFSYGATTVKANSNGNIYALFSRNNSGDSNGEVFFRHIPYIESPSNLPHIGNELERMEKIAQDKIKELYEMLNNDPSNLEKLADELVGEIDPRDIGKVGNSETINSAPNHEDSAIYKDNIPIGIMGYEQEEDDNSGRVNTNIPNMGSITAVQEQTEDDISRGITGHTDFELIPVDEQNGFVNITPSAAEIEDNTVRFTGDTRSEGGAVLDGIPDDMVLKAATINNAPPPAEEDSGGALHGVGQKDINISSDIYYYNRITTNGERVGISVPDVDPVPDSNNSSRNDPKNNKVGSANKQRAKNKIIR